MTISENIYNLRYLYIYQEKAKYEIKLNIVIDFPKCLYVYDVKSNGKENVDDENDIVYGEIEGNIIKTAHLKKCLIHKLEENK